MRRSAAKSEGGLRRRRPRYEPRPFVQNVTLTQAGRDYTLAIIAIIAVITELNREIAGRVSPDQLGAADTVLRAALFDDSARQRASRVPPPPGQPSAEAPS